LFGLDVSSRGNRRHRSLSGSPVSRPVDIPTFTALGQAYYEFEHDPDLRVAVLYGKGPDLRASARCRP